MSRIADRALRLDDETKFIQRGGRNFVFDLRRDDFAPSEGTGPAMAGKYKATFAIPRARFGRGVL